MSWFPSLKFTPKIEQRESYWGLLPRFEPSAKVTKQPGKATTFFGALTRMDSDGDQTVSDLANAEKQRIKFRLVGTTERVAAKAIKATGNQFEVKDRNGRVRGYASTMEEAEAKAAKYPGAFITDRIEGRRVWSSREKPDRDDIPDPGVYTAQVSEQWTIGA